MKTAITINSIKARFSPRVQAGLYDAPQLDDGAAWKAVIMKWNHPLSIGDVEYWPLSAERLLDFVNSGFHCALLIRYTSVYNLSFLKFFVYHVRIVDPVTDAKGVTTGHINVSDAGDGYFGLVDMLATARVGCLVKGGIPDPSQWNYDDVLGDTVLTWSATDAKHDISILTQTPWNHITPKIPLFSLSDVQGSQVAIANEWGEGVLSYKVWYDDINHAGTYAEVSTRLPWGCFYALALKNRESSYWMAGASIAGQPMAMIPLSASDMIAKRVDPQSHPYVMKLTMNPDGSCLIVWTSRVLRREMKLEDVANIALATAYGVWNQPSEFASLRGFVGLAV